MSAPASCAEDRNSGESDLLKASADVDQRYPATAMRETSQLFSHARSAMHCSDHP